MLPKPSKAPVLSFTDASVDTLADVKVHSQLRIARNDAKLVGKRAVAQAAREKKD